MAPLLKPDLKSLAEYFFAAQVLAECVTTQTIDIPDEMGELSDRISDIAGETYDMIQSAENILRQSLAGYEAARAEVSDEATERAKRRYLRRDLLKLSGEEEPDDDAPQWPPKGDAK